VNAKVSWRFMVPGAVETTVVDEFEPPSLIAFTWSDGLKARLEFTEPCPGRTRVSAQAEGFSGSDTVDQALNATEASPSCCAT
jgi:hypothetical protein